MNQTKIQTFKNLDWNTILKIKPQIEPYREELPSILDKHRPEFAADLNEIAIIDGVYYKVDLTHDGEPVNK